MQGKRLVYCFFSLICLANGPAVSVSENLPAKDLETLPLPASLDEKPVILSSENLSVYQDYLIAPLANFVQQGLFAARLTRDPGQNFSLPALWTQASRENEKSFRLSPEGELERAPESPGDTVSYTGFPFGTAEAIAAEHDRAIKGKKLLWNLSALPGIEPQLLYGIELSWFNKRSYTKQARGLYYREYLQGKIIPEPKQSEAPAAASDSHLFLPKFNKALDWRELLQLLQPAVIFGYASVTYRYREPLEDDVWTYSPVLGRSRRVLESNRSDSILGSQLTLNDLFLFSTRPQKAKAEVVAEKILLAPFALKEDMRLDSEAAEVGQSDDGQPITDTIPTARGTYRNRKGHSVGVLWNAESGVYPGLPGWIPTTIQLSPRKVWVVEIQPTDPFSAYGSEILFVDQQTLLPFYKVTYDRKGLFLRWSIACWTTVVGSDERIRFPMPLFILTVDRTGDHASAMETQYVRRLISDTPLRRKINLLFDIREHDRRAPKKEPTPAVTANESEEATSSPGQAEEEVDAHD